MPFLRTLRDVLVCTRAHRTSAPYRCNGWQKERQKGMGRRVSQLAHSFIRRSRAYESSRLRHNRVRSRSRNSDAIQITRCCYGSFIARQWIRWIEWNLTARKIDSIVARNARDFLRFRVYRGIYSGRLLNFTAVAVHQGWEPCASTENTRGTHNARKATCRRGFSFHQRIDRTF